MSVPMFVLFDDGIYLNLSEVVSAEVLAGSGGQATLTLRDGSKRVTPWRNWMNASDALARTTLSAEPGTFIVFPPGDLKRDWARRKVIGWVIEDGATVAAATATEVYQNHFVMFADGRIALPNGDEAESWDEAFELYAHHTAPPWRP